MEEWWTAYKLDAQLCLQCQRLGDLCENFRIGALEALVGIVESWCVKEEVLAAIDFRRYEFRPLRALTDSQDRCSKQYR